MIYDCLIIGGGIAGLQAAIQLGRYNYRVLVMDSGNGRSTLCKCYHNLLGWPEGVSGSTLRKLGRKQAEELNVQFLEQTVNKVGSSGGGFQAFTARNEMFEGKCLLFATGLQDNLPRFPELYPCLGRTVFICPDCDGFETTGKPTIVLGAGKAGVNMALALTHWTGDITFINQGDLLDPELEQKLRKHNINLVFEKVIAVHTDKESFQGLVLANGEEWRAPTAFLALGGNKVHSELAAQLGVELEKNKHIKVNPRTKMTNVRNVWAAGDVVAHSEQVAIAMGDGLQAAIWIHKTLKEI